MAAPIVFKQEGQGLPDTCLLVFDQAFHVHSTVLKFYSPFFRAFLDAPDKVNASSVNGFKYYWVTKVEEDGGWYLVAAAANPRGTLSTVSLPARIN